MIDIKWIRTNADDFDALMARRGMPPQATEILEIDTQLRQALTSLQEIQEERNEIAKQTAMLKQQGEDATALYAAGAKAKEKLGEHDAQAASLQSALNEKLALVPNPVLATIPHGTSDADNQELRCFLDPKMPDFKPKEHFELGEALGLMDFEQAARMSGSRFVILKGGLAQLERAISQLMLDTHTEEFGYEEVSPPLLVKSNALFGTGQLPKFAEESFKTTDDRWLIPTAEVPLTNMAADKIFPAKELPKRYTAFTPCFRSEAGAAGKDTRGMIRLHQFHKVEMVSFTTPEQSEAELERMIGAAECILKKLKIPYRVVDLCDGDIGFQSKRTYDIEAWMPGQKRYREVSSCSFCGDFQARRLKARFRADTGGKTKPQLMHTLNGSGLATGRTLIAVMENYQNADGSITVPDVLVPYMRGKKLIQK